MDNGPKEKTPSPLSEESDFSTTDFLRKQEGVLTSATLGQGPRDSSIEPNLGVQDSRVETERQLSTTPQLSAKAEAGAVIPATRSQKSTSPSVGQRFYGIAYELANTKNLSQAEAEQAIVFLTAAVNLGCDTSQINPLLLKLAGRHPKGTYAELVYYTLEDYVNESADLEAVREAIRYLLELLNTREEREILLSGMLKSFGGKNAFIRSELATLLGLTMAEKPDVKNAKYYFIQAYSSNSYNKLAFEKIVELMPGQIGPEVYLGHLKEMMREDPSNIEAVIAFAQYAEQLQLYDIAAKAYEHCANLFEYLYPSEPLPARIYIPLAICYYNTKQDQQRCLLIASYLRESGRFDLMLESIAGKAAIKIGEEALANEIFQAAEENAQKLLGQGPQYNELSGEMDVSTSAQISAKQFAWFYCFILPDADKALNWANKAYSIETNSPTTAALLAYALVMNQQSEWAKPLLESYKRNQIADLTLANIQLTQGQKNRAIETLNSAIAKDAGSLVAEQAKELLAQIGSAYVPPIDPNVILTTLEKSFAQPLVPTFIAPEEMLSVQLNIPGSEFPYDSKISGTVAIINKSTEPLVISEDGLLKGNIRIDADISGDLKKKIPNLVSTKICTTPVVKGGQSAVTTLPLDTGQLKEILLAHPQASLDIEFTLYLDPVITKDGKVTNRLTRIEPVKARIRRPRVELTSKYLRSQLDIIVKGQPSQKIKAAQLFIGLLREQQEMANRKPLYRYMYANWMPTMLMSALIHESGLLRNPAEHDWSVKVHTMADLLSFPSDQQLAQAVAENLNDANWPVRMMALYLLAKSPGSKFGNVLDWAAENDSNKFVRDMAVALGATARPSSLENLEMGLPGTESKSPLPTEPLIQSNPEKSLPILK